MNNKKIYLVLFFILSLAGCKQKVVDIQSGIAFDCAVHNNTVSCWGLYAESGLEYGTEIQTVSINTRKPFVNPKLAVGNHHYCVLDEGVVQCFLNNELGQTDVPELSNPYEIAAGGQYTCALDDNGLQCWGDSGIVFDLNPMEEPLVNPRDLVVGAGHLCLNDDNGLHCAGMNYYAEVTPHEPPEGLTEVSKLSAGSTAFYTCGLAEEWECWNGPYNPFPTGLDNVSLVVPGAYEICAIVDGQVECWGDGSYSYGTETQFINENITNPFDISVGADGICVAGDEGVYCENRSDPPFYIRAG